MYEKAGLDPTFMAERCVSIQKTLQALVDAFDLGVESTEAEPQALREFLAEGGTPGMAGTPSRPPAMRPEWGEGSPLADGAAADGAEPDGDKGGGTEGGGGKATSRALAFDAPGVEEEATAGEATAGDAAAEEAAATAEESYPPWPAGEEAAVEKAAAEEAAEMVNEIARFKAQAVTKEATEKEADRGCSAGGKI